MKSLKFFVYLIFFVLFSSLVANKINIQSDAEKALISAIGEANIDWLKKDLPEVIRNFPDIIYKKYIYSDKFDPINILAITLLNAQKARNKSYLNQYAKYLELYNFLIDSQYYNKLKSDFYSVMVIYGVISSDKQIQKDLAKEIPEAA